MFGLEAVCRLSANSGRSGGLKKRVLTLMIATIAVRSVTIFMSASATFFTLVVSIFNTIFINSLTNFNRLAGWVLTAGLIVQRTFFMWLAECQNA
ncbi:hypothetical protein [Paraglaciecola sp. 25GB23A]|uniref:hypothetical protein n=1 Tax=Paraglaciecola sp. 25GB23A TaxID=3156068 RepID=UPI0032AF967F